MTAPTPAALALARSSLPARRVSAAVLPATRNTGQFASMLSQASAGHATNQAPSLVRARSAAQLRPLGALSLTNGVMQPATVSAPTKLVAGGPEPISREQIVGNAEKLMGIPYVWGGTANGGLDCSAFVSKTWGVSRQTTDTLSKVATPISKDDLQTGDALNLTTGADPDGDGHVRLFDKWADASHSHMWVYEETPPRSVHHVIPWDPKYQPMRRVNVVDSAVTSLA